MACQVDVSDRVEVDHAMQVARRELGPVGILVTSAGVAKYEPFAEITLESWNRVLAINLTGTFHCVQAALPDMVDARLGAGDARYGAGTVAKRRLLTQSVVVGVAHGVVDRSTTWRRSLGVVDGFVDVSARDGAQRTLWTRSITLPR